MTAEAASDRAVPLRIKLAYGAGSIADGAKNAVFNSFLMLYYSAVLGLPAGWAGAAILVAMIVDAVTATRSCTSPRCRWACASTC
jgi:GPH family glycoside/pentoside/hexuronide:cation symporter